MIFQTAALEQVTRSTVARCTLTQRKIKPTVTVTRVTVTVAMRVTQVSQFGLSSPSVHFCAAHRETFVRNQTRTEITNFY
jgi:hypothetical protein